MGSQLLSCLFLVFTLGTPARCVPKAERNIMVTLNYSLTTKLLSTLALSDPLMVTLSRNSFLRERYKLVKQYLGQSALTSTSSNTNSPKSLNNMHSFLEKFSNGNCINVINNFNGIDLIPTVSIPIILRRFDLALNHLEILSEVGQWKRPKINVIWIPHRNVPNLNGNFSINVPRKRGSYIITHLCEDSKHFYAVRSVDENSGHCVGLNTSNFVLASKPWQCEVQVDLFLPDNILSLGKYTQIFRSFNKLVHTLPSLRPRFYILIDSKISAHKYNSIELASWITKRNNRFKADSSVDNIINHVLLHGYVRFTSNYLKILTNPQCNIVTVEVIFPCPECTGLVTVVPVRLEYLSINYISLLESNQKLVAFPGKIESRVDSVLGLSGQVAYFAEHEAEDIKMPLKFFDKMKQKYPNKLKMLGFAYASLYTCFMGNLTLHKSSVFENTENQYFTRYLVRSAVVSDS